jgi:hypothetical protein
MPAMTNIEIVAECVEASPHGICDHCIGVITSVKPHQQIVQICHKLEARQKSARTYGKCPICGRSRLLNKPLEIVDENRKTPSPKQPPTVADQSITPSSLDSLRRFLIQRLNILDSSQENEGFTPKVIRLRNEGVLRWNIAALMLTHSNFRNRVHHEAYECTPIETEILRLIDTALRAYFQT